MKLATAARPWRVVNASISGETTAGGAGAHRGTCSRVTARRRSSSSSARTTLRGLDLTLTERNLRDMVRRSKEEGARVLMLGIQVPPNYGRAYTERFGATFARVAQAEKVPLVPFFLDGVAQRPELFQPDRIHPTEQAQPRILENVWPTLSRLLQH